MSETAPEVTPPVTEGAPPAQPGTTPLETTSTAAPEVTSEESKPTAETKPTETVDFWKQKAREQEARAKSNAEKAKEFDAYQESQKTEQQKIADRAAAAERARDDAVSEGLRYKAAATHGISEDYFDLLGTGDEAAISGRAERIGSLLKTAAEVEQLRAENEALRAGKPVPSNGRPTEALRPGAVPTTPTQVVEDAYPNEWLSPSQRAHLDKVRGASTT